MVEFLSNKVSSTRLTSALQRVKVGQSEASLKETSCMSFRVRVKCFVNMAPVLIGRVLSWRVIMGHSQLFNVWSWVCASLSPQLLPCLPWLIGLASRIKKQCFRLIRKIPFVGGAVSISGKSVPSFPSRCALTLPSEALMSHTWMTEYSMQRERGGSDLWHT